MTKIILHGCQGSMGLAVRRAAAEYGIEIVAGIAGVNVTTSDTFPVFVSMDDCDIKADAIVDFSIAEAMGPLVRFAARNRVPAVICTTGLSPEQEREIVAAAKFTPIFRSANMSLGISMLTAILRRITGVLYDSGFDIEILEKHHNRKIDAPSGTAHLLGDTINSALDNALEPVYDRSQRRERRPRNELGFSSIRCGTVSGEHSVIFAGKDEVLEFKHTAISKEVYAVGAFKAVDFIKDKTSGFYTMDDLINTEEL